jgi:autotransporter-associated beta strand protein
LTISGANTYTGPTLVIAGTLATSTANRIPDASAVTILTGAIITLGGADTFATLAGAGTLTCGANSLTLNSVNSATFSGTLTNTAGTFFKSGTGTQTLSGSTTVAAQVRLDGGGIVSSGTFTQTAAANPRNFQMSISAGSTSVLTISGGTLTTTGLFFGENGGGTSTVNCNGGTMQVNGQTWQAGVLSTLNVNGGTFSAGSFDIGGGSGTITSIVNLLSGAMTLTGTFRWGIGSASATSVFNLDGGTFTSSSWIRSGGLANTFNFNGGTFTTTSNLTITQPLISCLVKSGGAIFSTGFGVTLFWDTVLANSAGVNGDIVKNGFGTLVLSQANTTSGSVSVNTGILQIGNNGTTGSIASASSIINGATIILSRTNTITQGTDFPVISGSGMIIQSGSGTTILALSNTYTGETRITAGNLRLGNASGFGSGDIRFNGGTMQYGTGITTDVSSRIKNSSSSVRIDTNGQNVDFASLGSTNTGGLVKSGTGILTISGSGNTYTGVNTISAGEVTFSGTYTANNAVNVNGTNPVINISGNFTQTFTVSGVRSFQLALNSGTTATANISGSAVVSFGAGMMLGDNGGGAGTMNVSGGTVNTNGGTWLAGSTSVLNVSGGTFTATAGTECGGGSGTTASTITVSGTGTLNANSLIIGRGGANATSVINLNGGTLTATGITHITTTAPTTINFNGGVFQSLNTMTIPSTISLVVKSSGAVFNSSGQLNISSSLNTDGTGGGLVKQGAGTLALGSTAHLYTGSTTISAGTVTVSKTTSGITGNAAYTPIALTVDFANVTPNTGDTYKFFPGSTATTGLTITLTNAGGKTASYNYSTSTLTIL